jgi:hypothetical protein
VKNDEMKVKLLQAKRCENCKHSVEDLDLWYCVKTAVGARNTAARSRCGEFEHKNMIEKCSNCKYWSPNPEESEEDPFRGECRIDPPCDLVFKETLAVVWCGKFQASDLAIASLAE